MDPTRLLAAGVWGHFTILTRLWRSRDYTYLKPYTDVTLPRTAQHKNGDNNHGSNTHVTYTIYTRDTSGCSHSNSETMINEHFADWCRHVLRVTICKMNINPSFVQRDIQTWGLLIIFTPWQACSIVRHLGFPGKHPATLQLMREGVFDTIDFWEVHIHLHIKIIIFSSRCKINHSNNEMNTWYISISANDPVNRIVQIFIKCSYSV